MQGLSAGVTQADYRVCPFAVCWSDVPSVQSLRHDCWCLLMNGVVRLSPGSGGNILGICGAGYSLTFCASGNFTVWSLNHVRLPEKQGSLDFYLVLPAKLNIKLLPHPQAQVPGFHRR